VEKINCGILIQKSPTKYLVKYKDYGENRNNVSKMFSYEGMHEMGKLFEWLQLEIHILYNVAPDGKNCKGFAERCLSNFSGTAFVPFPEFQDVVPATGLLNQEALLELFSDPLKYMKNLTPLKVWDILL